MSVSIICMSISIICVSMSTICILLYVCLCLLSVYLFLHICMPVSTIHITMSTIFIYVSTICKSVSAIYVCVLPEATSMVWETSSGILWFNQTRLNFSYLNTGSNLIKYRVKVTKICHNITGLPTKDDFQRRLYGFV